MAILPSGLETIDHGATGWNAQLTTNMELLDERLVNPMLADVIFGDTNPILDLPAAASSDLGDSAGGTPSTTMAAISGTGDDATLNNNFSSIAVEWNKLRKEVTDTFAKADEIVAALRQTGGVGVIAD